MFSAPYESAIKAISDLFKSITDFAYVAKEKQSETEIIKDKRNYKEATNIAEQMIKLAFKYITNFSKKDKNKFIELFDDFQKVN